MEEVRLKYEDFVENEFFHQLLRSNLEKNGIDTVFNEGSRAGGKTTAFIRNSIYDMLTNGWSILVIRRYYATIRETIFNDFVQYLQNNKYIKNFFKFTLSPLKIECLINGAEIVFKGLDNPDSVKGIMPQKRSFGWILFEEAIQFKEFKACQEVISSIRPMDVNPIVVYNYNTTDMTSWLYTDKSKNKTYEKEELYLHSLMKHNKFLPQKFIDRHERLKKTNPELYRELVLAEWVQKGNNCFRINDLNILQEMPKIDRDNIKLLSIGVDFGLHDATTFVATIITKDYKLFTIKEYYHSNRDDKIGKKKVLVDYVADFLKFYNDLKDEYQGVRFTIDVDGAGAGEVFIDTVKNKQHMNIRKVKKNRIEERVNVLDLLIGSLQSKYYNTPILVKALQAAERDPYAKNNDKFIIDNPSYNMHSIDAYCYSFLAYIKYMKNITETLKVS